MNMNLELNADQVLAMTACMLAISHVDGVHPAETALIQQFYEGSRQPGMPEFAQVQTSHGRAGAALQALSVDDAFGEALISMCLMTGYADGNLSTAEQAAVMAFAHTVGMSSERFDAKLQGVRDSLLGSLAHLPDAQSVAALAKEL